MMTQKGPLLLGCISENGPVSRPGEFHPEATHRAIKRQSIPKKLLISCKINKKAAIAGGFSFSLIRNY